MTNYALIISYNGKEFCGWAPQPNKMSIMKALQDSIRIFYKLDFKIYGSGRTDKGVHAIAQCASVKLNTSFDAKKLKQLINKNLPNSILVTNIYAVDDDFHARFSAKGKTYRYLINSSDYNVFKKDIELQVNKRLNICAIRDAINIFVGEHDFTSFCSNAEGEREHHIRTITSFTVECIGGKVVLEVSGNGFLRHMVRKLVGTLIAVGEGKIGKDDVKEILDAKSQRSCTYKAGPEGLYLLRVYY